MVAVAMVLFMAAIFMNQTISFQIRRQVVPLIGITGLAIVLWVMYQSRRKHGFIYQHLKTVLYRWLDRLLHHEAIIIQNSRRTPYWYSSR